MISILCPLILLTFNPIKISTNALIVEQVFHNIPASSQLLANYDPFYSPLLSRLDSVFLQLGQSEERCREQLVCEMYANPAKFAPFSNLVSAQLSRSDNNRTSSHLQL